MANIRAFIQSNLLEPLKRYPTIIQDTLIELIADKLEELYNYTVMFPEIISPNENRLDILKAIADQFVFTIRNDADLTEQVDILSNILYVYNKRGSIDTIENMWKYYGGSLPKDIQVEIPSYKLFRYSVSALSGTHVFQDNVTNRTGVYEVKLINSNYPIPDLRDFMIRELVAAGNRIYFTNILHMYLSHEDESSNPYEYLVSEDTIKYVKLSTLKADQGLTWSGHNPLSRNNKDSSWSGHAALFMEVTNYMSLGPIVLRSSVYNDLGFTITTFPMISGIIYSHVIHSKLEKSIQGTPYCTSPNPVIGLVRHLYNEFGELQTSNYPGYFIVGSTLLGREVI